MYINNLYIQASQGSKYVTKNPDTGNLVLTNEVRDKLQDEILENKVFQTTQRKK